jgi:hypothetical protein
MRAAMLALWGGLFCAQAQADNWGCALTPNAYPREVTVSIFKVDGDKLTRSGDIGEAYHIIRNDSEKLVAGTLR